jgi:toxin ParE1/3/4
VAEIRITPTAKAHLIDIWLYTANTWGEARADSYLMEIDKKFQTLVANPSIGKSRPEIKNGYHSIPANKHVVFYTITEEYVNIIGILHARMDILSHWDAQEGP